MFELSRLLPLIFHFALNFKVYLLLLHSKVTPNFTIVIELYFNETTKTIENIGKNEVLFPKSLLID